MEKICYWHNREIIPQYTDSNYIQYSTLYLVFSKPILFYRYDAIVSITLTVGHFLSLSRLSYEEKITLEICTLILTTPVKI